jgi:dihydroorotate dehydrogenase
VQLYSALAYDGPSLIARVKNELLACLAREGFSNIGEVVGADLR